MGLRKHLTAAEIVEQAVFARRLFSSEIGSITNVVFMVSILVWCAYFYQQHTCHFLLKKPYKPLFSSPPPCICRLPLRISCSLPDELLLGFYICTATVLVFPSNNGLYWRRQQRCDLLVSNSIH